MESAGETTPILRRHCYDKWGRNIERKFSQMPTECVFAGLAFVFILIVALLIYMEHMKAMKDDKQFVEWENKDIQEAIYKAANESNKLLKIATGYSKTEWKKINDDWNISSVKEAMRCPFFNAPSDLFLRSALQNPPIDCALVIEEVRRISGLCIDLSFLPKECNDLERINCSSGSKFRSIDGVCNNVINAAWGKSDAPFVRMIAPIYADGVSTIRRAKNGGPLPNARFVTRTLYSKKMKPDSEISLLFLYFGLLVDHDMIQTTFSAAPLPCCNKEYVENPEKRPMECLQIDISRDDPFYGPRNVTCLNVKRSFPVIGECGGRREQMNKVTSYLDGSAVYGPNVEQAKDLRENSGGLLRTQLIHDNPFMANIESAGFTCGTAEEPLKCFEAGDSRINMIVELTAMHTIWYREHNRIATELQRLKPEWTDETLYQEARRIVIAELQHIAYKEMLPLLLGKEAIEEYEIEIDERKVYEGYDDTVDATAFNVFGAAAYRFGHSLAPSVQFLVEANRTLLGKIPLHETFFRANILYHDGLDLLLRGASIQRTHTVDSYITPEIKEHLFQPEELDYGFDLTAIGILRGRDHGIPPYIYWRSVCGLSEVKTWDDLYKIMNKKRADKLKSVYECVEDIELIPGAIAENHVPGSLLGPTYVCLIGRQFRKTRKGDRFWFENQNEAGSFTKDQLREIYKSSLSRIICDNSDGIKEIQRYSFKVSSHHNPVISCDRIPRVDLKEWN